MVHKIFKHLLPFPNEFRHNYIIVVLMMKSNKYELYWFEGVLHYIRWLNSPLFFLSLSVFLFPLTNYGRWTGSLPSSVCIDWMYSLSESVSHSDMETFSERWIDTTEGWIRPGKSSYKGEGRRWREKENPEGGIDGDCSTLVQRWWREKGTKVQLEKEGRKKEEDPLNGTMNIWLNSPF